MNKAYLTDSLRSIRDTFTRFVSIIAIVTLGCSIFCGFNAVYPDMVGTADAYYKQYNLMDLRLQSFLGLYDADLDAIRAIEGVKAVQGERFVDGFVQMPTGEGDKYEGIVDIDGSELTLRVMGLDLNKAVAFQNGENDPNYINRLQLIEGRYPEQITECVVTCSDLTTPDQFKIGNTIRIAGDGEEMSYYLKNTDFTIVGIVKTPYWVSYERGTTTAGSGKLGDYIYVKDSPEDSVFSAKMSYYSEVYVTLDDADEYGAYSKAYDEYVSRMQKKIVSAVEPLAAASRNRLNIGLEDRINAAKPQIAQAEGTVNARLDEGKSQLDQLYEMEKSGADELERIQKEVDEKYDAAQADIQAGSDQYVAAVEEYNQKQLAVSTGQAELEQKKLQYNQKRTEADLAKEQLDKAETKIAIATAEINATTALIASTETTLNTLKSRQDVSQSDLDLDGMAQRLEQTNPDLAKTLRSASNLTAQGMAADAIVEVNTLLDKYKSDLVVATEQRDAGQQEWNARNEEYQAANDKLIAVKAELDAAESQLNRAQKELDSYKEQIEAGGNRIQYNSLQAQTEYTIAQVKLAQQMTKLQNIKAIIAQAEETYAKTKAEVNASLGLAKTEYNRAQRLLKNIQAGAGWSVYTRHDSPGYSGYGEAAENMRRISYFFPVFFFLVSTLICLTTMTRMVEEERIQLGTLKALGYTNRMISSKYTTYAVLASSAGAVFGIIIGFIALPLAITSAWNIMYEMPDITVTFYPTYIILGILISVVTTVFATRIACRKDFASVPAVLMRPKSPKDGKRVWLERITPVWKRLSFTGKVTMRNLFRNKRRFVVTVLGIAGCTALLLTSFGLRNAIGSVIADQYGENGIDEFDLQVVIDEPQISSDDSVPVREVESLEISGKPAIKSAMLAYLKVCTGSSSRSQKDLEVDILVPEKPQIIRDFINIRADGKDVPFTDDGAVITRKLSEKTKTGVGDYLTLTWTEGSTEHTYDVKVLGVADNYTFHYVYMTPYCYHQMTHGVAPTYNYLFCNTNPDLDSDEKAELEKAVNNVSGINGTVYTSVIVDSFSNIVRALNIIIYILIAAAMALAVVVLYNLNNININERVKELATLKVLGFYDTEVSSYIYRENIILTFFGVVLGLLAGVPFDMLVIRVIDIDALTFKTDIGWLGFVLACAVTLFFALVVNIKMHFNLKKISMVESLKSVE